MWLPPLRSPSTLRLFCLPYAGGGITEFARWGSLLPPAIEVVPVRLPGRDVRLNERPISHPDHLVDALVSALLPALDQPFALFGHSMGAALAFAVASRLAGAGAPLPLHLFLSARGPTLPANELLHPLPEPQFLAALQARYGALPEALLRHRDLLDLFLPALRADMRVAETIDLRAFAPVRVPATAFVGTEDPIATPESAVAWSDRVGAPFRIRPLSGGHFFLRGPNRALLDEIGHTLTAPSAKLGASA